MNDYSTYIQGILLAYAAFTLGILSPGPNILNVIATSMSHGRKAGVSLAMGVAFGTFSWASLTAIGLSALLVQYAYALQFIKMIGGLYLLWLAYKAIKNSFSKKDPTSTNSTASPKSNLRYFTQGYIVQMTNPKAALTWVAIISLGMQPNAPHWVAITIVVGASILSVIAHIGYAVAFSTQPIVEGYLKTRRYIQSILSVFYIAAAYKLFTSSN